MAPEGNESPLDEPKDPALETARAPSVLGQSAIIFVLGWLLLPLQFVTSAVVARSVGPEGKGVLFLLAGLTAVVTSLTSLGLSSGAVVLYKQKRRTAGEILGTTFLVTLVSLLVLALVYGLVSRLFVRVFFGDLEDFVVRPIWIALALVTVLPSGLVAVADVLLIADDAMWIYALRGAGTALLALVLTWALVFGLHLGITGVLLSQPIASVFGLGVVAVWAIRRRLHRGIRFSTAAARDLLRIGVQQWGISLVALVSKRFDGFLIATMLSVRDAGYYSIANGLQGTLVNIPRATLWPLVSSMASGDPTRVKGLARAARIQTVLMLGVAVVSVALAGPFVRWVFGASFAPSVGPTRWALLGIAATPLTICANALFTARGRPGLSIITALVATGVQVVLNLVLVPRMGATGSAIALSAQYVIAAAIQVVLVRIDAGIPPAEMILPTRADGALLVAAVRERRLRFGRLFGARPAS